MAQDREQDRMDCKQPEAPLLCANNCGLFGCPTTMNLCSKCYKSLILKEESGPGKSFGGRKALSSSVLSDMTLAKEAISAIPSPIDAKEGAYLNASSKYSLESHTEPSVTAPMAPITDVAKHTELVENFVKEQQESAPLSQSPHVSVSQVPSTGSTRCLSCRRRVGLLGFKCRCGGVFCSSHRYSDKHECTFDYKAAARDAIARANPVVKAEKVEKI